MPGLARRLRVALDWTMDLLFAKDAVQLGLAGGRRDRPPALAAAAETPSERRRIA